MKLLFDTSVWVEHLRRGALDDVIGRLRGHFVLCLDSVVAAELRAGCRSKRERRVIERLLVPFGRGGRVLCPSQDDYRRAGGALSRLRERGIALSGAGGALLDALIAAVCVREGARLVTVNMADFSKLALVQPLRVEPFDTFVRALSAADRS